MTWLYESPGIVLLVCLAIGLAVQIVCSQISQHAMLMGGIGTLVLGGVLLGIEHFVVTDHEKIENTLHGAAAAMKTGDIEQVRPFLVSRPIAIEPQAQAWLNVYRVRKVRLTDLKIMMHPLTVPPSAVVDLWAHVELEGGSVAGMTGPFHPFVTLNLEKEGDAWLISDATVKR